MSLTLVKSAAPIGHITQRGGRLVATSAATGRVIGIYGEVETAVAAIKAAAQWECRS